MHVQWAGPGQQPQVAYVGGGPESNIQWAHVAGWGNPRATSNVFKKGMEEQVYMLE